MEKIFKIWFSLLALIITASLCYFLCSRANIGRYQYYNYGVVRADQYILDTKKGRLYQTVCGEFEKDKNGKTTNDCSYMVLQPVVKSAYEDMVDIVNYRRNKI